VKALIELLVLRQVAGLHCNMNTSAHFHHRAEEVSKSIHQQKYAKNN
jgi:hypothetical protein